MPPLPTKAAPPAKAPGAPGTPFRLANVSPGTQVLLGMGLMVSSAGFQSAMYVAIRSVPPGLHPFEVAFMRNLLGLVFLLLIILPKGLDAFRTRHLRLYLARGVLNSIAMLLFFVAVLHVPLAEVTALNSSAPLFAGGLAVLILGETFGWRRAVAMGVGIVGTLVILRPGFQEITLYQALLVGSSLAWASAMVVIKVLSRTESPATVVLYMMLMMTPLTLLFALPFWVWPTGEQWAWGALMAVLGTMGQYSLSKAFQLADASAVLPLDFTKLVWAATFGLIFFAEMPDPLTLAGGALIIAGSSWLAIKERSR